MAEVFREDDPYDLVPTDDRCRHVPERADCDCDSDDLPRPSLTQHRERIAALDQEKDRHGERAQHDCDRALGQNPESEHRAHKYFLARRTGRCRRVEQRINRAIRGEEQKSEQHVGQRFGRARRESVSAEHQQKREPSFGRADVGDGPREHRDRERCARHYRHSARANLVDGAARRVGDECGEPVEQRWLAIGVAIRVVRNQPVAVAHDALNPFGRLRLRVFLKRRADALNENDESKQRGDRKCRGSTGQRHSQAREYRDAPESRTAGRGDWLQPEMA